MYIYIMCAAAAMELRAGNSDTLYTAILPTQLIHHDRVYSPAVSCDRPPATWNMGRGLGATSTSGGYGKRRTVGGGVSHDM